MTKFLVVAKMAGAKYSDCTSEARSSGTLAEVSGSPFVAIEQSTLSDLQFF